MFTFVLLGFTTTDLLQYHCWRSGTLTLTRVSEYDHTSVPGRLIFSQEKVFFIIILSFSFRFRKQSYSKNISIRILSGGNKNLLMNVILALHLRQLKPGFWTPRYKFNHRSVNTEFLCAKGQCERLLSSVFPCKYHATISSKLSALHNIFPYAFHFCSSNNWLGNAVV